MKGNAERGAHDAHSLNDSIARQPHKTIDPLWSTPQTNRPNVMEGGGY